MPPSYVGFVGLCLNGELRDCEVPHENRCHDKREICPVHSAQVQTCDCTSSSARISKIPKALALWKHPHTKHFPIFFPPTIVCNAQMILLGWCRSFIVVDGMLAKGGASAANQKYLNLSHLLSDLLPCFVFILLHSLKKNKNWVPFDTKFYCPKTSDLLYFQLT